MAESGALCFRTGLGTQGRKSLIKEDSSVHQNQSILPEVHLLVTVLIEVIHHLLHLLIISATLKVTGTGVITKPGPTQPTSSTFPNISIQLSVPKWAARFTMGRKPLCGTEKGQ